MGQLESPLGCLRRWSKRPVSEAAPLRLPKCPLFPSISPKDSESLMPSPSPQKVGRGAKARICVHCGRAFRRTEHLERHVRTRKRSVGVGVVRGDFKRLITFARHQGETVHLLLWGGFY